jgi:glycerophosphoryl diester phosphodiesterase
VGYLLLTDSVFAFDLVGHRGARGLAPENTLPGFARALSLGVTALEFDTAITKDGVVVISHDPALNPDITRDKNGKWLRNPGPTIYSLTFEELQQYDVGRLKPDTNYAKLFPEQKAVDGTRIPKLADLIALVRKSGNEQVRFNIEIKVSPLKPSETLDPETFAKTLVELIRKEGIEARVSILSFDWRTLQVVQKIAPQIPTVYISGSSANRVGKKYPKNGKSPFILAVFMTCKGVRNNAMNFSCKNISDLGTRIAFRAFPPSILCLASSEILDPESWVSSGGEKNCLWGLWPGPLYLLRPEDLQGSRPALCGSARLPGHGDPARGLPKVREGEAGEAGLVGRLSFLHQTVCLLRRPPLSGFEYSGHRRRAPLGLENGQGLGDAVHARDTAPDRYPGAGGHWSGRGFGP